MSEEKVMNRWLAVVGAILIQLALGAIYAWSVFTKALTEPPYGFSVPETQAVFSAGLFTLAVVMIIAGIQMKKHGPTSGCIALKKPSEKQKWKWEKSLPCNTKRKGLPWVLTRR